jgi:hypothetical protein
MTPKEKAEDLFSVFCIYPLTKEYGQYLSLKAVDEIIQAIRFTNAKSDLGYVGYWQEVKQEIENI